MSPGSNVGFGVVGARVGSGVGLLVATHFLLLHNIPSQHVTTWPFTFPQASLTFAAQFATIVVDDVVVVVVVVVPGPVALGCNPWFLVTFGRL